MQLYLLLYTVLEVFLFVIIGQQIGFLLMISLYLLVTILGFIVCRKVLLHIAISGEKWIQQMRAQQDLSELSEEEFDSRFRSKFTDENIRIFYLLLAQFAFVVPGLITEIIAIFLLVQALLFNQSCVQEGGLRAKLGRFLQKIVPNKYYSRYNDYNEEMYRRYGKSERDMAREYARAAAEANEKVPQPNEKAGQSSVEEMKAKFQENKVIKEACFEEIHEDDKDEDVSVNNAEQHGGAAEGTIPCEKSEQSHKGSDKSVFRP